MASRSVQFDVLALAKATGFEKTSADIQRLAKDANEATKSTHLMSTALTAGAAASIPVLGVAAGAMVGFGAAAGVALVGVLGIRDAMKEGSALGQKYTAAFTPLIDEFGRIKQIAAAGMFAGINAGLKGIQPLFPAINRDVAVMSRQIGEVAKYAGPALATLFVKLNPLFVTFGGLLVQGAAGFQRWLQSSNAVGRFVAYVQQNLPSVLQTLGQLVKLAGNVVVALEPFGSTLLTGVRLLATALNSIPLGVLQAIVPLLAGLKIGASLSAGINNAAVGLAGYAKNLAIATKTTGGAAGVVSGLGKAVGFLGPVGLAAGAGLGVLSLVMGRGKQAAIENQKAVNDLTQAIQDNNIQIQLSSMLQSSGATKAAQQLSISQGTLIGVVERSGASIATFKGQMQGSFAAYRTYKQYLDSTAASQDQFSNPTKYKEAVAQFQNLQRNMSTTSSRLQQLQTQYDAAKKNAAAYARQTGDLTLASQVQSGTVGKVASAFGVQADAYYTAKIAADKNAQSVKANTIAMQLENNAAGLLSAALNQLGGDSLGVAQAQTAVAEANKTATATLKQNHIAIKGTSDAAIADQKALQGAAQAAIQHGQAVAQQTGSTVKATKAINDDKAALEANLRSQGLLTPAVQRYIDTLFRIPARKKTQIDINAENAAAKAQHLIDLLNSIKTQITVQITESVTQRTLQAQKNTRALGGPVAAGMPYIVGERGPELFVPGASGTIVPQATAAPRAAGGQTTVNVYVTDQDPRATVRALEQWLGGGGKLHGGRGIVP